MTEDTSPENLRKFLESDDPAMVRMGLSMAKGAGVHEDLLPTILRVYMWNDDKIIRSSAKSIFNKHASKETQDKIKLVWKPQYRNSLLVQCDLHQYCEDLRHDNSVRTGKKWHKLREDFEKIIVFYDAFQDQEELACTILNPLINFLGYEQFGCQDCVGHVPLNCDMFTEYYYVQTLDYMVFDDSQIWPQNMILAIKSLTDYGLKKNPKSRRLHGNEILPKPQTKIVRKNVAFILNCLKKEHSPKGESLVYRHRRELEDAFRKWLAKGDRKNTCKEKYRDACDCDISCACYIDRARKDYIANYADKGLSTAKGSGIPEDLVNLVAKLNNEIGFTNIDVKEKTLAGAVIWYDLNAKERDLISKKLSVDPKEMITKYWMKQKAKDIAIDSKDLNLPKKIKDDYYLDGPHLELCKKKMTCRGCPKVMIKGELRLSLGYNGFTMVATNHYFCRKCVTNFIKPSVRYKLIEKWWETNGWIRLSKALEKKDADYLIKMLDDRKRKRYVWGRNPKEGKWLGFSEYILQTSTPEEIKNEIIEKLGNLGDKKALSPLIEIIDENDLGIVATSLSKIVKKNKLENSKEILKFLKSNEEGMKRMGASMLKGILEE